MLFRPNRELLAESLAAAVEITTMQELIDIIDAPYFVQPLQLSWEYQKFDTRCNWDTWIICAKMPEYEWPQAVGHMNGNPELLS